VVALLLGRAMRKRVLNIVVSPVLPVVDLVSVDAATPSKKRKKNTRSVWNIVSLLRIGEF
jgi:hypothetical protein